MEHKVLLSAHAVEVTQGPADPLAVLTKGLFRPHRHFCLPAAGCCFLKCAFQTKKERGQRAQRLLRSSQVLFFKIFFRRPAEQNGTFSQDRPLKWSGRPSSALSAARTRGRRLSCNFSTTSRHRCESEEEARQRSCSGPAASYLHSSD